MSEPPRSRSYAARVAVAVSLALAAAKLIVSGLTGSVSLLASGLDSGLDVLASGLSWWAISAAAAPPDAEHRFGHGKLESLAALAQAAFVGGSGVLILTRAVARLGEGAALEHPVLAVVTAAASTVAAFFLVRMQTREATRTGSVAVTADRAHYLGDVLAGTGVVAGLVLGQATGWAFIDPAVSLLVAAGILWTGVGVARRAVDTLLDHALPATELKAIEETLRDLSRPGGLVVGYHGLRTRGDGLRRFVEVHLEMPGETSLSTAHAVYVDALAALRAVLPGVVLSVHLDPAGEEDDDDHA